jgi:hypothetical protein
LVPACGAGAGEAEDWGFWSSQPAQQRQVAAKRRKTSFIQTPLNSRFPGVGKGRLRQTPPCGFAKVSGRAPNVGSCALSCLDVHPGPQLQAGCLQFGRFHGFPKAGSNFMDQVLFPDKAPFPDDGFHELAQRIVHRCGCNGGWQRGGLPGPFPQLGPPGGELLGRRANCRSSVHQGARCWAASRSTSSGGEAMFP